MFNDKYNFIRFSCLIVGIIVALSVLASLIFPEWKSPAGWLLAWTNWVGSVVGIVVAAKVFWAGGEVVKECALKRKAERKIAEAEAEAKRLGQII